MMSNLKVERVKRDWTQSDLSEKSGVSRVSICNIERNGIKNIPVYTLQKLAAALNSTVSELFFSDEQ